MTTKNSSFGNRLKDLRKAKNCLLRKVAADLDMDQSILSKIENGLLFPNNNLIEHIAQYYHAPLDELQILLYADKIMADYGHYQHAQAVINLVNERLSQYDPNPTKSE